MASSKNRARLLRGEFVCRIFQIVHHLDAEPVIQRRAQRQDGYLVIER
jgi:hypothetical protein